MKTSYSRRSWAAERHGVLALIEVPASLTNHPAAWSRSSLFLATVLPLLMFGLTANSNFLADSFPTPQGAWQEAPTPSLPPLLPSQREVGRAADGSQQVHHGRNQEAE